MLRYGINQSEHILRFNKLTLVTYFPEAKKQDLHKLRWMHVFTCTVSFKVTRIVTAVSLVGTRY